MNDALECHIQSYFPDLGREHYLSGVVDLRFAWHEAYGFRMWRKETWRERKPLLLSLGYRYHGHREWTGYELDLVIDAMEREQPEDWASHTMQLDLAGHATNDYLIDVKMNTLFDGPGDVAVWGGYTAYQADKRLHFWMFKPENEQLREDILAEWVNEYELTWEQFMRKTIKRCRRPGDIVPIERLVEENKDFFWLFKPENQGLRGALLMRWAEEGHQVTWEQFIKQILEQYPIQ